MYKTFRDRWTERQELGLSRREVLLFSPTVILIRDLRAFRRCCCTRHTQDQVNPPSIIVICLPFIHFKSLLDIIYLGFLFLHVWLLWLGAENLYKTQYLDVVGSAFLQLIWAIIWCHCVDRPCLCIIDSYVHSSLPTSSRRRIIFHLDPLTLVSSLSPSPLDP